ncbi:MAG: nucleotidyltransferase domain-containing protein [bacterium]
MERLIKKFVKEIKHSLKDNVVFIGLFGSRARGDFNKESDIDILIVVKEKSLLVRDRIFDIMFEIDPWYELMFSPRIMSLKEYEINKGMGSPFIDWVEREGIRL